MRNRMVSETRIDADIKAMSQLTEPDQPWTRRSFTPMFDLGREWLKVAFAAAGLEVTVDAGGNLVGRREGSEPGLAPIALGSHSDTVPEGGRFDGVAGVIAALEVARSLDEGGVRLRRDLLILDFLAEEVSGFGVSCIGSRAMAGVLPAEWLTRQWQGRDLGTAINSVGGDPACLAAPLIGPLHAFMELHIEQGTVLESERVTLGLVGAIAGITRIEIIVEGRPDHAGTTPMNARDDALVSAAILVGRVRQEGARPKEGRHFAATVGEFDVQPNAANVIPGRVRMLIDARAEARSDMEAFVLWAADLVAQTRGATMRVISDAHPVPMDAALVRQLAKAADENGIIHRPLTSGAGHDAAYMTRLGPAAMIFVPSRNGRSHCPEEWSEVSDIASGAEVMAQAVIALDQAEH